MDQEARHETVFDTGAEHLGRVYAEALLAAADSSGVSDQVVEQLQELVDALHHHPQLSAAFNSPRVDVEEKQRVIDRLLGAQVHSNLLHFLKVVARRGRLGYLPHIANAAMDIRDERLGRVVAEVRSAVPLSDELRQSVQTRLGEAMQREIVLREKVDPQIIGGLVIRIGDTVFDTSVANQLATVAKRTRQSFARKIIEQADRYAEGAAG